MNIPANIADKIALANLLAGYLHGTDFNLAVELAERGIDIRALDGEFGRVLNERLTRCPDCNCWVAADAYCDCDDGDWEYGDDEE